MLRKLGLGKKIGLSLVALIAAASISYAGGMFQGFPLVGGAGNTNCLSAGNNNVCNQYQPAGPTSLTGNETVPADTNVQGAGSSANPSTVAIALPMLGAGPTQYSTPLTGATTTVSNLTRQVIINPAGTIAAHTLTLPAANVGAATALLDGQRLGFCTTQVVTALTVNAGSGTTVSNAPTAMLVPVATGAASCVEWIYVLSAATWFRTQ